LLLRTRRHPRATLFPYTTLFRSTKSEYAVVFPDYFYGQIYEARHQPGTFALPSRLIWELLDATCEEIARNGFTKIVIVNGHGGRSEEHTSELQSRSDLVCRLLLE